MKKIDKKANMPINTIESISETAQKEKVSKAVSYQEIRKLKKLLKSEPKSLWKYLQKKEK